MKRLGLLLMLVVVAALGTACDAPTPTGQPVAAVQSGPAAWIDAPLNRSSLPLAPYEVVFHCNVPSGVAWVELTVDGAILVSNAPPDTTQALATMRYVWTPPAPGNYTLRARAGDAAGVWSEYATSVVTVEGEAMSPTPPTPPTPALSPTTEPTQPPSATECAPSATFTGDGICRAGPAMDHGVVTVFSPGQTVTVDGLDVSGTWWRVLIPGTLDHCWVPVAAVSTTCVGSVSVVEGPTAPAPTAMPTSPTLAPTWTPTPIPVPTVTPVPPAPQPPVIAAPQASADIFYSDTKCGVTQLTLQVIVDDSDGVSGVTFNYWLKDKTSGAESGWAAIVPMQRVSGSAMHGTWKATLDGPAAIGASPGHEYTLRYYLVATDAQGASTQSPTYENVTLSTRSCVH
jgi:hypothetical protein